MYNKIKKQNGEKFAKTIRNYHNGILEIPDIDVILRHAGRDAEPLMSYLMSLLAANDDVPAAANPFDLLKQAGYTAFHADTLEKQNSITHYFAKGELLCTFNDASRHEDFYIVHAIKDNAVEIKREDFRGKESRQDEYGTSVISIQMIKKGGFISIKNRYNHAVANCDNTFNSNPDNIIQGLSSALKDHFNVDFSASKTALPEGYALFNNQIFQYHTESNNIYYGDGAWVKNGTIHAVNKSAGDALFEGFLFDNKTKTLQKIDSEYEDSFADDFNRYYGGNKGLYVKDGNLMLGDDVLIGAEKSRIKTINLPALITVGDKFLSSATELRRVNLPALTTAGAAFLYDAPALTEFNAPNLATTKNEFLSFARALTEFNAPNLTTTGESFLFKALALTEFNAPNLTTMGDRFLSDASALTEFNAPNLTTTGYGFLSNAHTLTEFNAPNLTTTGDHFLSNAPALREFNAPNLTTTESNFLSEAHALTKFNAPNLTTTGGSFLSDAPALTEFNAPNLTTTGYGFLSNAHTLTEFNAPNLATTESHFLSNAHALTKFNAPNLTTTWAYFLSDAHALTEFNAPALKNIPDYILEIVSKNSSQNSSNGHSILNETTNYLNLNL